MKSSSKLPDVRDTQHPVRNDGKPRRPDERDTAPDIQSVEPRKKIKQAYEDIERGLVDTDLREERGVEAVKKNNALPQHVADEIEARNKARGI